VQVIIKSFIENKMIYELFLCFETRIINRSLAMKEIFKKLKFDEKGLIPAIAQDEKTGEVLMMAWMNEESLRLTIQSGYATYFSRSRNSLWKKGETSGHLQEVVSIAADCDFDCVLMKVKQTGAACHTGKRSCFFNEI
jgi:phosphoribosyl-AMP cyclohydrolase